MSTGRPTYERTCLCDKPREACGIFGICVSMCPQGAIRRKALEGKAYEYAVDETLCIGCGFCAGACPCGVWDLTENQPLE